MKPAMPRFRLRTLMIAATIGPPLIAFACLNLEIVGTALAIFALWFTYVSIVIVLTRAT